MTRSSALSRLLGSAARRAASAMTSRRTPTRRDRGPGSRTDGPGAGPARLAPREVPPPGGAYPGDFEGPVTPVYAPDLDGEPDPGEIVWTWVPYEEDHTRGKDRPVLVVGHDGPWLLGLMLTSRDHDARPGRRDETWVDLGSGDWDPRRRPSEARADRVLRLDPSAVRREGAVLDRARFDRVVESLGRHAGW